MADLWPIWTRFGADLGAGDPPGSRRDFPSNASLIWFQGRLAFSYDLHNYASFPPPTPLQPSPPPPPVLQGILQGNPWGPLCLFARTRQAGRRNTQRHARTLQPYTVWTRDQKRELAEEAETRDHRTPGPHHEKRSLLGGFLGFPGGSRGFLGVPGASWVSIWC